MNNKFCHLRFCKLAKVQDIFKSPQYSNFMGLNNLCLCFCSKLFLTLKHYLFYFFHSFFLPCNFYFLYSSISPFLAIFLSSMPKWLFLYNRKDQSHYDFGQHWSGVFGNWVCAQKALCCGGVERSRVNWVCTEGWHRSSTKITDWLHIYFWWNYIIRDISQ